MSDAGYRGGAVEDWVVAVPSRKRSFLMPKLLGMIPHAHVYVDEVEYADYEPVVPKGQLFTHPSLSRITFIERWMLDHETASCCLLLDDDLQRIASFVRTHPKMRSYTKPCDVDRIIANMVNRLADLDLNLGGWNVMAHPGGFNPTKPTSLSGVIRGALMVRGRTKVNVDTKQEMFDIDLTLQALLKSRVLIKDMRYFFDFGATHENAGGNRGVETGSDYLVKRKKDLADKWGDYLVFSNLPMSARMHGGIEGGVEQFGHRVQRVQGRKSTA